jgi:hypothetical protein
MSGGQGGGCHFENTLTLLKNCERAATCRYHIPYVVAYVVPHVEAAEAELDVEAPAAYHSLLVANRSGGDSN